MSKFGETTYDYTGFSPNMDATGIKGEDSNLMEWSSDPEEIVGLLFKGTEGASGGKYSKWCKDEEGSINGVGPNCATMKEIGERDTAVCYYRHTRDCLEEWREVIYESSERFAEILQFNVEAAIDATSSPTRYGTPPIQQNFVVSGERGEAYDDVKRPLDPEREIYVKGKEAYDECIEKIEDDCECKQCVWTVTYAEPPEEPDDDEEEPPEDGDEPEEEPTGFDPLKPEFADISTTSNFDVIPRVWGRYVVGGNIIWVGNIRTLIDEVTYDTSVTGRVTAVTYNSFADIHLGLCAGTVDDVLRVWFDEVLLVNNIVGDDVRNSATDYDVSTMAPNPYDLSNLDGSKAKVVLRNGSSTQKVSSLCSKREGFGRVPAYRDLAYIDIRGLNISSMGGKFPEVRVEVATKSEDEIHAVESAPISGVSPLRLNVDPRSGQLSVTTASALKILDWDTLDTRWETPLGSTSDVLLQTESGFVCVVREHMGYQKALTYDQSFSDRITTLTELYVDGEINEESLARPYLWFDAESLRYKDLLVYTDQYERVCYLIYDFSEEAMESLPYVMETFPSTFRGGGTTQAAALVSTAEGVVYDQYLTTSTGITVSRHTVVDSSGALVRTMTSDDYVETTVDNLWKSGVSATVQQVVLSAADNTLLILTQEDADTYLYKVGATDLAVYWKTLLTWDVPAWGQSSMSALARAASQELHFLSNDSELIHVDLSDGTATLVSTLAASGLPLYVSGGGQFFDGRTNSLTYLSEDETVVRVLLDRVSPLRVSVAEIVEDLAVFARISDIVDASALEGVTVAGYAIQEPTSLRGFLEEVGPFLHIGLIDDGTRLTLVDKSAAATPVVIDEDTDIIVETLSTSRLSPSSVIDTLTVTHVSVDDTGMFQSVQTVTTRGDEDAGFPVTASYDLNINEEPLVMRQFAEKTLTSTRRERASVDIALLPRKLAVAPGDTISLAGSVYRVGSSTVDPSNIVVLAATGSSQEDLAVTAEMSSVPIPTGVNLTKVGSGDMLRPVVLFINALSNEDSLRSTAGRQIVYSLVESGSDTFDSVTVNVRVNEQEYTIPDRFGLPAAAVTVDIPQSPLFSSGAHTKAAHQGHLMSPPMDFFTRTAPFTSNADDEMTVRFARESSVAFIATLRSYDAPAYEVLESETENILIVDAELIKFGSYEIVDSLTVRFYNLFRGWRGTEPYMTHGVYHYIADDEDFDLSDSEFSADTYPYNGVKGRVYLYTSDTVKPISMTPSHTKLRASARVFLSGAAPAGYRRLEFAVTTDAGSARPWSPTDPEIFAVDGDQTRLVVRAKRRHPTLFDGTSVGAFADVWDSQQFLAEVVGDYTDAGKVSDMLNYYAVPSYLTYTEDEGDAVLATFEVEMSDYPVRVLLAHVSKDDQGGLVFGHPSLFTIEPGEYPALP